MLLQSQPLDVRVNDSIICQAWTFSDISGQHILLCDQTFISTGYAQADFVVAYK